MCIDENLSINDVVEMLADGLLPTGSAIMDGDSQVWPLDDELEVYFCSDNENEDE